MNTKLAIVTTHPIQYYAPVFQLLARRCSLKVFYTWGQSGVTTKYDPDFGKTVAWDIPLLEGYDHEFLENRAKKPGSHHFKGIQNHNVIQRIQAFDPDIVLVYGWAYSSHLKVLRYFNKKVPLWFRGDSTLLNTKSSIRSSIKKVWLRWIYSHIDKAFYVGSANKAYFKKYGLKDEQLIWAPHAIDNTRFSEDRTTESCMLRKKLGILENTILILFAGKFQEQKNPEILLRAFDKLEVTNAHLLFVGNGVLEKRLRKLANSSKNKSRISFMDFQNQQVMPVIYQMCDIFCLCSISETWGLAVNEAMAAGKAVIVSDKVGCATDLIEDALNGFVFKSGDEDDFLLKLKLMLSEKKLSEMGEHSRNKIKDWSFEKQVDIIINQCNLNQV